MTKIEMVLALVKSGADRHEIQRKAKVSRGVYNSYLSTLRKRGLLPQPGPSRWVYIGTSEKFGTVRFRTQKEAWLSGFDGNEVGAAARGQRGAYLGYEWTREPA